VPRGKTQRNVIAELLGLVATAELLGLVVVTELLHHL